MKLVNHDIWIAYHNLVQLSRLPLSPKTGVAISAIVVALELPFKAIERECAKLCQKYGAFNAETNIYTVDLHGEDGGNYTREVSELMVLDWNGEFNFSPVEIPNDIIKDNENTLAPLWGKFVRKA